MICMNYKGGGYLSFSRQLEIWQCVREWDVATNEGSVICCISYAWVVVSLYLCVCVCLYHWSSVSVHSIWLSCLYDCIIQTTPATHTWSQDQPAPILTNQSSAWLNTDQSEIRSKVINHYECQVSSSSNPIGRQKWRE